MRRLMMTVLTFTTVWAESGYRVSEALSNGYYRAETSLLLIGTDEIVGVNPALTGYVEGDFFGGELLLDAKQFDTDNGMRDGHVRDILDTETYPTIRFLIASIRGIDEGEQGEATCEGILSVRAQSRRVTFPVRWKRDGTRLILEGKSRVSYRDFGIAPPDVGWGVIKQAGDAIEVGARVVLVPGEEQE